MKSAIVFALVCSPLLALAGNAAGEAFLEENKKKEGVITLPSGFQYKVLTKGQGAFHPTADSSCSCHYAGTLIDGTTFDSSYDRGSPTSFAPNQVIKGWTEAMQLMVEGDKWEMYIPSELGYGERGSPPKIQGGDTLIFQMEILEIKGDKVPALKCSISDTTDCNDKEKAYITKTQAKIGSDAAAIAKELKRLQGMTGKKMSPELTNWLFRRVKILEQMTEAAQEKSEL